MEPTSKVRFEACVEELEGSEDYEESDDGEPFDGNKTINIITSTTTRGSINKAKQPINKSPSILTKSVQI